MAVRMGPHLLALHHDLLYEPTRRRVRGSDGERVVVDTERAVLLWEPGRVVPQYAVPEADVTEGVLDPTAEPAADGADFGWDHPEGVRVLPPGRFRLHTTPGDELDVRTAAGQRVGAAFRLADPDLAGYVVVDFTALSWWEEEDEVVAHPRDPFKRIDVVRTARHVVVEHAGSVLADSRDVRLLFETGLPVRYYVPAGDVELTRLTPSASVSWCAYKGRATHWSVPTDDAPVDVAWTYHDPLPDAVPVTDLIAFYDERLDVTVDGVRRERQSTPWS